MENIINFLKIFGPWAIASVSFIAFIVNYRYNEKKDIENKKEVNNLKAAVKELKTQTNEIQLIRKEAGVANEINARSVIGLREKIFELRRQTEQFIKTNEVHQKASDTKYLPELFVSDLVYFIHSSKYNEYPLPFSYSSESTTKSEQFNSFRSVSINLLNIGFAAAKSVKLKWSFDINNAFQQFEIVKDNSIYEAKYSHGMLNIRVPVVGYVHTNMVSNQLREQSINYILPATIDSKSIDIEIPRAYLDLYSMYLSSAFCHFKEEGENKKSIKTFEIEDFPNLFLNLKYLDLQNKEHQKTFVLEFQIYSMSTLKKEQDYENRSIGTIGIKIKEKTLHTRTL